VSKVYRQTISDELAARVEVKRHELGLSIQEVTIIALAFFCQQCEQPQRISSSAPAEDTQENVLTW
jgi:hypothetical protein